MSDIPEDLLEYLVGRDAHHAANIQRAIDALTPFERRLLREAAVMGYVRGQLYGRDDRLPADHAMIRDAVGAAIAMDFPLLSALARGERPEVTEQGGHIPGGSE